ncbi:calcium/sodium antiporter [Agromyces intestinalis]|uniref:Calcium/sodium antiporter n=1 Tax=Agromyces intestinalis TaxID=2592652 RepID=A0A5C1YEF3_9MICO|nr:calcium/sodium antiporter [Agromyces intestinalis]QEO14058.1 calcium/sodium antiporter [Agromyces intestinalis]
MPPVVWLILGLVALVIGAELVVRSGARLARRLGIPPIVVGLTVVSIGTSLPELAVGIDSVRVGAGSLAVGNIAGTNVVNILLILGLSAAIRPLAVGLQTLRLDLPMMGGAALLLYLFAVDGVLDVWEGVPLVLFAIVYTLLLVRWTRRESSFVAAEFAEEYPAEPEASGSARTVHTVRATVMQAIVLVAGIAVTILGADWLVDGAVEVASALGVSDALIGLTIVAIGTSAPELATTIISTIRGERDIAIGNLIGSSIYNLTIILGVTLLVAPGAVPIEPELVLIDLPIMVAVSFALAPIMLSGRRVSRLEGSLMVTAYLIYLGFLVVART